MNCVVHIIINNSQVSMRMCRYIMIINRPLLSEKRPRGPPMTLITTGALSSGIRKSDRTSAARKGTHEPPQAAPPTNLASDHTCN